MPAVSCRTVTRRTFALALAAALLAWAAPTRATEEPFGRLSVDEVERLLGRKDVRVVDVNSPEVYAKARVPGAALVALGAVERSLPADKTITLVYYCKNGH